MVLPLIGAATAGAGLIGGFLSAGQRDAENRALDMARKAAEGKQPSHAEILSRTLANQAARQNLGMAGAYRGSNPNLGVRNAMQTNATMQGDIAGQAQALRAQEMAQARQQYAALANNMGDEGRRRWAGLSGGVGAMGAGLVAYSDPSKEGGAAGLAGSLGGMFTSDERLKSAIRDAGFEMDEFLDALRSRRFTLHGREQNGIMAQDLEQSQAGREMVRQGPDGVRRVDASQAVQTNLAATARLNERIRMLESALGRAIQQGGADVTTVRAPGGTIQATRGPGQGGARVQTSVGQAQMEPRYEVEVGRAIPEPSGPQASLPVASPRPLWGENPLDHFRQYSHPTAVAALAPLRRGR